MCSYKKIIETRSFVKNNQLFLTVLEAGKAKIKAASDLLELRACFLVDRTEAFSLCPWWEGAKQPFMKRIPFIRLLPSLSTHLVKGPFL
jgi:hypothetical protein